MAAAKTTVVHDPGDDCTAGEGEAVDFAVDGLMSVLNEVPVLTPARTN
jgi:hypothetical protein